MRKNLLVVLVSLLVPVTALGIVGPAGALANGQTITFGESPGDPLTQYTAIGVTFGSGPCCINEGVSNGDSGNWGLEGTNDPYFLGFNGPYAVDVTLDESVTSVSLDAARSNGSTDGSITLEALSGATVVDTETVVLGAVDEWSTLTVTGAMDGFRITGDGADFHPFGVDNIVIGVAADGPPVADAGADQSVQLADGAVEVTLDGTGSSDPDDDPLTYAWSGEFEEGTATGANPIVTFTAAGTYTVVLVVNDGTSSATDTVDIVVAAEDAPTPPPAAEPVPAAPSFTG